MKWYLVIQFLVSEHYLTAGEFPSETACQAAEDWAREKRRIGFLAAPISMSYCIPQRVGENRFPTSETDGEYICKYAVGKCIKINQ